ncbi:MAG: glycosyltransferase [Rikenellaceae bacterium]
MSILLQINVTVNFGSTGRIAEEIGQLAISQGWESYIAYGRDNGTKSRSNTFAIGGKLNTYYHALQTRLFDREGLGSRRATKRLIKYIDNIKPDIIHLHNIHGYFINYPLFFEYLSSINTPVIWTMHDCWSFSGHCAYFDAIGCKRWLRGCYSCPQKREYPSSLLFDRSEQNFIDKRRYFTSLKDLTLVPVSDWLAGVVKKSFLKNSKIHRIYNGVNIDVFKPQPEDTCRTLRSKYGFGVKYVLLGVASVWESRKGLGDFLKLNNIINDNILIVLVGLTSKQIEQLPKNIIGICRTENINELVGLYSVADIVLNLSLEETFGLTTVEGFACGTPSIVYNKTASPELVSENTGIVVEHNNILELNNAVNKIIDNKDLYSPDACRQRAVDNFNKNDRFAEYIDIYNLKLNK